MTRYAISLHRDVKEESRTSATKLSQSHKKDLTRQTEEHTWKKSQVDTVRNPFGSPSTDSGEMGTKQGICEVEIVSDVKALSKMDKCDQYALSPSNRHSSDRLNGAEREVISENEVSINRVESGDDGSKQKSRQHSETSNNVEKLATVDSFTNKDVLMGRGNHVNNLPGNLRFRRMIHPFRAAYNDSKNASKKREILFRAYDAIVQGGNQFLDVVQWKNVLHCFPHPGNESRRIYGHGVFRTVELTRALEKVAQALREPKWRGENAQGPVACAPEKYTTIGTDGCPRKEDQDSGSAETKIRHILLLSPHEDQEKDEQFKNTDNCTAVSQPEDKGRQDEDCNPLATQFKHVLFVPSQDGKQEGGESNGMDECLPLSKRQDNHPTSKREKSTVQSRKVSCVEPKPTLVKRKRLPCNGGDQNSKKQKGPPAPFSQLNERDVLFGRGHHANKHSGNVHFRQVVKEHKESYAKLPFPGKRPLAQKIYDQFGGRFWEVVAAPKQQTKSPNSISASSTVLRRVELDRCLEKICQALREKYSSARKQKLSSSNERSKAPQTSDSLDQLEANSPPPRPTSKQTLPSQSENRTPLNLAVGSRIAVYWPIDKTFYEASVEDFRRTTNDLSQSTAVPRGDSRVLHNIRYSLDNETEWIDLSQHEYKTLDDLETKVEPSQTRKEDLDDLETKAEPSQTRKEEQLRLEECGPIRITPHGEASDDLETKAEPSQTRKEEQLRLEECDPIRITPHGEASDDLETKAEPSQTRKEDLDDLETKAEPSQTRKEEQLRLEDCVHNRITRRGEAKRRSGRRTLFWMSQGTSKN